MSEPLPLGPDFWPPAVEALVDEAYPRTADAAGDEQSLSGFRMGLVAMTKDFPI
jgi:hypothetical protein